MFFSNDHFFTNFLFLLVISSVLIGTSTAIPEEKSTDSQLTIASLSFMPEKWNKGENFQRLSTMISEAASRGAELIVTPEGALEGYVIGQVKRAEDQTKAAERFLKLAEPIDGEYIRKFRELAGNLKVYLVIGFAQKKGDKVYNSAALIDRNGQIVGVYHKNHRSAKYYEPSFYYPGDDIPVFETEFGKIGIMICYDRQVPEVARCLALKGARLILNPAYGSTGEWNDILIRTRARDNGAVIIFTHPKQSLMADESGTLFARSDGINKILIKEINLPSKPAKNIIRRRPELYKILTQPNPLFEKPEN